MGFENKVGKPPISSQTIYKWHRKRITDFHFLSSLIPIFGETAEVEIYFDQDKEISRAELDGQITLCAPLGEKRIAVILSDFRVHGASYSHQNGVRLAHFIKEVEDQSDALVLLLDTLGIRFVQGRTVFNSTFQNIECILQYRKKHLVIAAALERVLGIGGFFFAQGHYRLALKNESLINLTGPEVMSLFFGEKYKFEEFASAGHQIRKNTLVHEIAGNKDTLLQRIRELLSFPRATSEWQPVSSEEIARLNSPTLRRTQSETNTLLASMGDHYMELFSDLSSIVRVFLASNRGKVFGVLFNPPMHPNNMMSVAAVDKTSAALEFFDALGVPLVSMLDCPGGDPRPTESDADSLMKMIRLVHQMIEYPHGKMGMAIGRCYGGSAVFGFPKIYGGWKNYLLDTSKVGIISEGIVDKIIEKSPRMKEEWAKTLVIQKTDMSDMIESKNVDGVISMGAIRTIMSEFLNYQHKK